ncbi:MAG: MMPL family transporter [Polyangiaceae bacterium]
MSLSGPSQQPKGGRGAKVDALLEKLAAIQFEKPFLPIAVCVLLAAVGILLARGLELRTRFDQLLPDNQPSVLELRRVLSKATSASKAFVVLEAPTEIPESDASATLRSCSDALVPAIAKSGAPHVTTVANGVQDAREFLLKRAGLFLPKAELEKLDTDLEARWDWEVSHRIGTALDDDEPAPAFSAAELRKRFKKQEGAANQYPDGYYQSADRRTLVVVATTDIAPGDLERQTEALGQVKKAVGDVVAAGTCPGLHVGYTGDLVTGLTEYVAIREDLVSVGAMGLALVLGVILVFFMRVRALFALGAAILVGLAWTFGLTRIFIGHLNVATGFLISIIAGNGINAGIIFMGRFFEELRTGIGESEIPSRRTGRPSQHADVVREALRTTHLATWPSTLTAALTACAAYGSLGITDFRAFKHFAFIGAAGILACWVVTYTLLPAVLVVLEKIRPFRGSHETLWGRLRLYGVRYDAPFAWVVSKAPWVLATAGAILTVVGLVATVLYVVRDPLEYDMRKVRTDAAQTGDTARLTKVADSILGATIEGAMIVVVDRLDQVKPLMAALDARRDEAPVGRKPFQAVHSIYDFVPDDQAAKIPLLESIRERILRARDKGFVTDADWKDIEPNVPEEGLVPYGLDELPADVRRPFTEKDGSVGKIVLVEPTAGEKDTDLHYLLRFAAGFRETKLPTGELVRGSGRAVIFADMLTAILADMPKAIVLSLFVTLFTVFVSFPRLQSVALVLGALGVGIAWLAIFMFATYLKLNFFNFVALPITFGIGVEYAVNLVQRYDADRTAGVLVAVRTTGGAIVLCSLTTILGYLALLGSVNPAIRSLGSLAVEGEVCCLAAALLVLPSVLLLVDRVRKKREGLPIREEVL